MDEGQLPRRLLTAREAAEYLGISLSTLVKIDMLIVGGPYRTPGGHRRYSEEMLKGYLEKSRRLRTIEDPSSND